MSEREEKEQLAAARRNLGKVLKSWRLRAGLAQQELAQRTGYSRSTVASAEGGQPAAAAFWAAVDRVLGAGGDLAARHARIEATVAARRRRTARTAWEARTRRAEPALTVSTLEDGNAAGEDLAVAFQDQPCPRCRQPLTITIRLTAELTPEPGTAAPPSSPSA